MRTYRGRKERQQFALETFPEVFREGTVVDVGGGDRSLETFLANKERTTRYISLDRVRDPAHVNSAFEEDKRGVNTDVIGRFRDKLNEEEIARIESFCRTEMVELGYQPLREDKYDDRGLPDRFPTRLRKYYMMRKESVRAAFKNHGLFHWISPIIGT